MPRPVGHSGHSFFGGRKVRCSRCPAMATQSPVSASRRISPARARSSRSRVSAGLAGAGVRAVVEVDDLAPVRQPPAGAAHGRGHALLRPRALAAPGSGATMSSPTASTRTERAAGRQAAVGDEQVDLRQLDDGAEPDDAPLRVVGEHAHPAGASRSWRGWSRPPRGWGWSARRARPCRARRGTACRRAACAGRRRPPGPTRASDGVRTPPVSTTVWPGVPDSCSSCGHRDRVRHDREVRDVAHRAGELVGRGAGRDADRGARARRARPRPAAMACFCGVIRADFAVNPGSSVLRPPTASAPPCTRSTRPSRGQLLDVAADRHVRDAELVDEVGDAHRHRTPRRGRRWSRGAGWQASA